MLNHNICFGGSRKRLMFSIVCVTFWITLSAFGSMKCWEYVVKNSIFLKDEAKQLQTKTSFCFLNTYVAFSF